LNLTENLQFGPTLAYQDRSYRLAGRYDLWLCYHSDVSAVGKFRHFLIIKADRGSDGTPEVKNPREESNFCTGYAHAAVIHDKLLKLSRGQTHSMHYRSRAAANDSRAQALQLDLATLSRLSLSDVFGIGRTM
jgi:hypothetical protein